MPTFIAWAGFLGAWLLFAGPIFQAALELAEEDDQRETLARAGAAVGPTEHVSAWWWLVPPVHFVLQRRISRRFQEQLINGLTHEQLESLVSYINKANGWLLVAGGGLLIAVKETWELTELQEWPTGVFWLLAVVMGLGSVAYLAIQTAHTQGVLNKDGRRRRRTRSMHADPNGS